MATILFNYIVLMSVVTFIIYGIDKLKAIKHKHRISEATLLMLAAAGGSLGALLGMWVWHHKTLHKKFYIGVPAIIFAQTAIAMWFYIGFE